MVSPTCLQGNSSPEDGYQNALKMVSFCFQRGLGGTVYGVFRNGRGRQRRIDGPPRKRRRELRGEPNHWLFNWSR